ncbi:alpha/beta hydrolase [Tenacibaculum holothuriorum]|uniref:Monoacylglycerol lipase n=1 Tax=Tenacibaculum holothuriorum TaxID=1635173 RepID=A0A1Y2P9W1_9FLAO|nr:alpha/beta hydrolase [Tenacibaculum holothuriorum]OSY86970.1 alpha/beta hydrolase [Tenacibaculum holothuriorum]
MNQQNFTFHQYKTDFYGQYWQPENLAQVKAVIVLVHGMGEHLGRYQHVAEELVKNNYTVVAYDQFGHGKTTGKKGHNPSFEALLESVDKAINKAKELHPKLPVFLYGHSMGGNVVINYTLRKEHDLKGVIATSPFLQLAFQPPAWKLTAGKILQKITPSVTLPSELETSHISRIPEEVTAYENDPLVHDKISPNYGITIINTGKWAIENATKLKTPMLLLHGTDDKIIDYKGTEAFHKNSTSSELKLYPEGYHELHNDFCKDEMLNDIITWLNSKVS